MNKKQLLLFIWGLTVVPVFVSAQAMNSPIVAGDNVAIVKTESGAVKGYIHNGIYTYKGMPYAYADRFMEPTKPAPWQGVRSSMAYGPVCPIDATLSVND